MSWQDSIPFPMPKFYFPDEDFIGKKMTIHTCECHKDWDGSEDNSMTGNCNCELKGKTVTITGKNHAEYLGH